MVAVDSDILVTDALRFVPLVPSSPGNDSAVSILLAPASGSS